MSKTYKELWVLTSSWAAFILCKIPPFLFLEEELSMVATLGAPTSYKGYKVSKGMIQNL